MGSFRIMNSGCKLRDYCACRIHTTLSSMWLGSQGSAVLMLLFVDMRYLVLVLWVVMSCILVDRCRCF
jgi:hypothetical protein